jgi:hypothetical protein
VRYDGPWREAVIRSAITLKMLIYQLTGARSWPPPPPRSPEDIGGVRNWDYRYTWLRDAGFTLNALYAFGCTEARAYAGGLCAAIGAHGLPLWVLHGIDGATEFPEHELGDPEGYRGSRPIRAGNAAEGQLQLDSYGELLDCLTICEILGEDVMRREWEDFRRLVDFVVDHWRDPDSGIWEVRDAPRHLVHSKAMAWVALDRGYRLVDAYGLSGDLDRWRREADALRAQILTHGVIDGRFRRAYDDEHLDASLLMLPIVGFVDGTDPLALATLDAIRADLTICGAAADSAPTGGTAADVAAHRYPAASGGRAVRYRGSLRHHQLLARRGIHAHRPDQRRPTTDQPIHARSPCHVLPRHNTPPRPTMTHIRQATAPRSSHSRRRRTVATADRRGRVSATPLHTTRSRFEVNSRQRLAWGASARSCFPPSFASTSRRLDRHPAGAFGIGSLLQQ